MQLTRTWKAVLACICAVILSFTGTVRARAAEVDFSRTGTIQVTLMRADASHTPVPYGEINIYQVAEVQVKDHQLVLNKTSDFAESGVLLSDINAEGLAQHLLTYARTRQVSGMRKTAGADGSVKFESLELGLYLVAQDGFAQGYDKDYLIEPFLVVLPMANEDRSGWEYDITACPKTEEKPEIPSQTSRSVRKIWKEDNEYLRPEKISVSLLRDGEVYETVTLSEDNHWEYSWIGLSDVYTWTVSEPEVPDGYAASYETQETMDVITNTYTDFTPDEPYPNPEDNNHQSSGSGSESEHTGDKKLPQTGQLRWPIPILAAAGIGLFTVGWCLNSSRRRDSHDERQR